MPPGESLHVLELGLFKMMIEGFYVNLGYKPGSTSYPKILQLLDLWAQNIGSALGHQSDRKMRRTYFPNVILTGGTKLAGHKMNGVILVLLILYKMKGFVNFCCRQSIFSRIIFVAGLTHSKACWYGVTRLI
jgi:hypothetical protein